MGDVTMVEFPTGTASGSAQFMEQVFGWKSTAYGAEYRDIDCEGFGLGFQQNTDKAPAAPLVVIEVDDLDEAMRAVTDAGGTITVEPFGFPGGRRFHFREPGGNVLAAWVPSDE